MCTSPSGASSRFSLRSTGNPPIGHDRALSSLIAHGLGPARGADHFVRVGGRPMSVTIYRRPPRPPAPEYPSGEVLLEAPPAIPVPTGRRWAQMMMMLPMLAGAGAMGLMYAGQRGGPLMYATGGLFGVSALG